MLNELTGAEPFFKRETMQKAGAFKVHGATDAVFELSDEQAAKGVATHSSGNHGTCLSYAEPEQADDAYRGLKADYIIADDAPETVADGLTVPLKELTWHFVKTTSPTF